MNAPLEQLAALRKSSRPGDEAKPVGDASNTGESKDRQETPDLAETAEAGETSETGKVLDAEVPAEQLLESLQQELNRIQRSMRLTLQAKLQGLVGRSLGSLEHNRALAAAIQTMLDQHGFRLRCQQCGHAAILRVSPRKGIPSGAFVLDHTIDGKRTFHGGGAIVPPIHLLAKPQRKPRGG
ncbi:hypothetical protein NB063_27410 [Rhodopirellula sp. ICT_H3.1]|uniref:Uncharacterized protein n=1 Tax=Aporhodopirellula aestuarii TaxID=2950107 RepID=A0ABT0UDA9_9BACT|nr:hypothetical protein [Aporhodopirellula aestuarii]